jgi:hypothetical protein
MDYHTPARVIRMIPSSKITLRINNNNNATSHYAARLRNAATQPALLKRYLKHYRWNTTQFKMIDWKVHHGAIQKLRFTEKKLITKCIHQSLPMGKVFHKIDPSQSLSASTSDSSSNSSQRASASKQ